MFWGGRGHEKIEKTRAPFIRVTILHNFDLLETSQDEFDLAKTQPEFASAIRICCPQLLIRPAARQLHLLISWTSWQFGKSPKGIQILFTRLIPPDWTSNYRLNRHYIWATYDSRIFIRQLISSLYGRQNKERFLSSHQDLRNVKPLTLLTTIQTYTIALDLDARWQPSSLHSRMVCHHLLRANQETHFRPEVLEGCPATTTNQQA